MLTACPRSHAARQKKSTDCWNIFPTNRCLAHNYSSMSTPAINIFKSTLFLYNYPNDLTPKTFYIVTTLCTVLFDIPKCFAACLTVALFSIIYCAISNTLSSIYAFKKIPCIMYFYIVCRGELIYVYIHLMYLTK